MEVIVASRAGFCFGVRHAYEMAIQVAEKGGPYEMLGYLVHNRQVIEHLQRQGIGFIHDIEESSAPGIIIRTHGVPPETLARARARGLEIVDATCPRVRRVQKLAQTLSENGYTVIIFGDQEHAEVIGLKGYAGKNAIIIGEEAEIPGIKVPNPARVALIAQTTKDEEEFLRIKESLASRFPALLVHNTICQETRKRQEEALFLAQDSDMILVVGDRLSSNTRVLADLCKNTGVPTYLVSEPDEIDPKWVKGVKRMVITAGASTPDWTIKEVYGRMTELEGIEVKVEGQEVEKKEQEASFADMEAEMAEAYFKTFEKGDVVTGTVVQVTDNEVLIDVGGKSEGTIPLRELSVHEVGSARDLLKVGDTVEAMVLRWDDDGTILLSKKRVDMKKALDELERIYENGGTVTGKVLKAIKGGLLVDVGVAAFLPASHVEEGFARDLEKYVGETMDFKIIEFNRNKRRGSQVVLSRKSLLEQEKAKAREAFWAGVEEGQIRKGKVKRLTDYGAFIDLGGFEGLLHISEMDYGRVERPLDVLKEGEEIDVFVLAADPEKKRVSLSRKRVLRDPWETVTERYHEGDVVKGRVVRTAPFGAFVELEPGIDGLVHISQLAKHRVEKPEDVVSIGQEVEVKVLAIEPNEKRISLSIKQVENEADRQTTKEYLENQPE